MVRAFREWQEQSRLLEQIQVVFVVGPPKCGTTWVQSTFSAHPNAISKGEGRFGTQLLPRLLQAVDAFNDAQHALARESGRDAAPDFLLLSPADRMMLVRQAIDRMLVRYITQTKRPAEQPIAAVIDKTPDHARHMRALSQIYPWAKFILVTRDPRDAAVSAWHHRELLGTNTHRTIDELAVAFAQDVWGPMMRLARDAGAALGPTRFTEITYEQYKEDPRREVRRLLGFIGLTCGDAEVDACVHAGDFTRQTKGRAPGVEAKSFHRKGVVGDWRIHLSPTAADRALAAAQRFLSAPIEELKPRAAEPAGGGERAA